jgi:hypothetical protein
MLPPDLAEQTQTTVKRLKQSLDAFLETYQRLGNNQHDPKWPRGHIDVVTHMIRKDVIPVMEQAGMEHQAVQSLCAWAERMIINEGGK